MKKNNNVPTHIAIIMDGNGRWAKIRGKSRIEGHLKAKKSVRESIEFCVENKINYLSLFAFSTENWSRPKLEVKALMNLLDVVIKEELNNLIEQNIKLKVIGDIQDLPKKTRESLQKAISKTKENRVLTLILAINYSGKWDILNATKKIAIEVNGRQHSEFVPFFHGTRLDYFKSIKRDVQKAEWLELNGYTLIELERKDIDELSLEYIEKLYGVSLI